MTISYFDSHCHFDFDAFSQNREKIWQLCCEQGLSSLLVPGVEPKQWADIKRLADQCTGIVYAAGLHPWWLSSYLSNNCKAPFQNSDMSKMCDSLIENLIEQSKDDRCVAIGECGLDKTIDTPLSIQVTFFEAHLKAAEIQGLPVVVHCVKAHNEVLSILKKSAVEKGVVHAFSGSEELALQYWKHGFLLGVGGTISYERAKKTRETFKNMPIDALVLETDAPDMPLSGRQSEANTPLQLLQVAEILAELRNENVEYVAQRTTENSRRLFSIG